MAYRNDVEALVARHAALSQEVAERTRELEQSTRLLDEARTRLRLPVLDKIKVAAPCAADWNSMIGDQRVRACGDCQKNVYNLSEMTRDEAQALLIEKEGKLCVRYFQRADGTVMTKDCAVGVRRRRRRRFVGIGIAFGVAAGAVGYKAVTWTTSTQQGENGYRMGAVAASEPIQGGISMEPVHADEVVAAPIK